MNELRGHLSCLLFDPWKLHAGNTRSRGSVQDVARRSIPRHGRTDGTLWPGLTIARQVLSISCLLCLRSNPWKVFTSRLISAGLSYETVLIAPSTQTIYTQNKQSAERRSQDYAHLDILSRLCHDQRENKNGHFMLELRKQISSRVPKLGTAEPKNKRKQFMATSSCS